MLTFHGAAHQFCDRFARRDFLRIGGLAFGGLTLPGLLRAEHASGSLATGKSIINIYLPGGPTHLDLFDLKPKAPREFRGELSPIATNVPGLDICELMPRLARIGNQFSVVRSITGLRNEHAPFQSDSGWSELSLKNLGGRPGIGSVMSRLWGPSQTTEHGTAPTFVDLTGWTRSGFTGQINAGYRPDAQGRQNLSLNQNVSLERLDDRRALLEGLDRMQRSVDNSGMLSAIDSYTERAVGIVTSGQLAKALDIRQEDPRVVDRFAAKNNLGNDRFLLASRLIQAGVRCVSFSWGGWDTHGNNFVQMRRLVPALDQGMSALINDLEAHGALDNTIIMMSGEFGRTPRVNKTAGRDHWPRASFFFLAGGGLRHGQAIGATSKNGEEPIERPVHLQHVFHTVYQQLGIDPNTVVLNDPNGRPQYLLENRQVISELL
ncbi:DUF1501 domain-containing protein [Schlesneria paludicola]|uniref:DUF1501 domain-containing protein n=1 Tax=Schlesneria paludicola TaxID=360056 RepID=UPI000299E057|nr:DUF1501 domain-containing protein [Schlesneria paludicola]